MPMAARTTKGIIRTSYRPQLSPDGKLKHLYILCTLFRQGVKCPEIGQKPDISYKRDISFNALNGEIIPDLYSDMYDFDANDSRKWHLEYKLNLDAASINTNHKYEDYSENSSP